MTLKEKFQQIEVTVKGCDDGNPCIISNKMFDNSAKQCEQIADDFAIGFAEWVSNSYYSYNFGIKMFEHRNKEIYKTTSELLQIYKKEK